MNTEKPKSDVAKIQKKLQDINNQKEILGYILKNSKSAFINIKDPEKLMDYALFSASTHEVGNNVAETLQMGEIDTIVVESEENKLLFMNVNNHHLSLFMEKKVDHEKLFKNLQ